MSWLNEEGTPVQRFALTARLPIKSLCFDSSAVGVLASQLYASPALTYLPLSEAAGASRALVPHSPAPRKDKYSVMEVACLAEEVIYVENTVSDQYAYHSWSPRTNHTELLAHIQPKFYGGRTIASTQFSLLLPTAEPMLYDVRRRAAAQELPIIPASLSWISLDNDEYVFLGENQMNTICRVRLRDGFISQRYQLADTGAGVGFVASTNRYCYAHGQFYTGVYVWDKLTGIPLPSPTLQDPDSLAFSLAMSDDETKLAVGSKAGYVTIYAIPSGETLYFSKLHTGRVSALAFSGDSSLLASGGASGDVCVLAVS